MKKAPKEEKQSLLDLSSVQGLRRTNKDESERGETQVGNLKYTLTLLLSALQQKL